MRTVRTLALVLAASAAIAPAAHAQDEASTLAVDGEGQAFVTPDVATLSLGSVARGRTPAAARADVSAESRRVLAAVRGAGIPDAAVTTTQVSIAREAYGPKARRRHRYRGVIRMRVRVTDVSRVAAVIDAAAGAHADELDGPEFSFSDPSAGRRAATRAALADARSRADDAAAAMGYEVTGVKSVVIDGSDGSYAGAGAAAPAPDRSSSTPVSPGEEEVDSTVHVVYEIAPA